LGSRRLRNPPDCSPTLEERGVRPLHTFSRETCSGKESG
jgi:hypothetical protein